MRTVTIAKGIMQMELQIVKIPRVRSIHIIHITKPTAPHALVDPWQKKSPLRAVESTGHVLITHVQPLPETKGLDHDLEPGSRCTAMWNMLLEQPRGMQSPSYRGKSFPC